MTDIHQLAEKTVKLVMKLGASHCDVVVADSTHIVAEIEKSSIKQASEISDVGVGVRAFKNGCSGFAYSTGHEFGSVKMIAELAVTQARAGTPDPDFRDLPSLKEPTRVQGLFDKRIAEVGADEVVGMAISLADSASADPKIKSVNAGVAVGREDVVLANSNGFSGSERFTAFDASAEVVARAGGKMFSAIDFASSRRLEKGLVDRISANAMENALKGLKQTKLPTGDYPIVMDPLSVSFIIMTAIGGGANAENVQRQRSYLAGYLGKKVGAEQFTVSDDPTLAWSSGSYSFDGEGVPSSRTQLIEEGILRSYLHDSYTAGKDRVQSTGNASRGGSLWSYRRPPSIASSTIVVKPGDSDLSEMLKETKKGIFLRTTYDYPNLATGEFSGLMMESFVIDKGELGPSVRQATMGIGMIDMFTRIDMIGKKSVDAFGARVPAVRISRARIGGSA